MVCYNKHVSIDLLPAWSKLKPALVMLDLEDVLVNCFKPAWHPFLKVFLNNNGVVFDVCDRIDPSVFIRRSKRISDVGKVEPFFEETRDVRTVVLCTGHSDEQCCWSCFFVDKMIDPGVDFVSLCSLISC